MRSKCPLCEKSYESDKRLERHCQKIHNKSLEQLRAMGKNLMSIGDFCGGEDYGL